MKKLMFVLIGLWLSFGIESCGHKQSKKYVDPNIGKHKLVEADVRRWPTYPLLVLLSVKHQVGVDTVAQLVQGFDKHFKGDGVDYEPVLPTSQNDYEEDAAPVSSDVEFLGGQARRYGLYPSVAAAIINDFYLSAGSNRDFPERGGE